MIVFLINVLGMAYKHEPLDPIHSPRHGMLLHGERQGAAVKEDHLGILMARCQLEVRIGWADHRGLSQSIHEKWRFWSNMLRSRRRDLHGDAGAAGSSPNSDHGRIISRGYKIQHEGTRFSIGPEVVVQQVWHRIWRWTSDNNIFARVHGAGRVCRDTKRRTRCKTREAEGNGLDEALMCYHNFSRHAHDYITKLLSW